VVDLDELLKIAGASNDARTRSVLELNLQRARGHCTFLKDEKQTPAALFKQLDKSLTRTLTLLQQLEKQPAWRDICFRVCPKTSGGITKFSEHEAD
jgi:hypothetical protein